MLEAQVHDASCFATLTYDDENIPEGGSLDPRDLQLSFKRLRRTGVKFRYFAVGEYGDATNRPHYHVAYYGFRCTNGGSHYRRSGMACCATCHQVQETWGKGHVRLGELNTASAQYIGGYVTKKMTAKDDARLMGRHPEFARMSLRPGIGALAMHDVASTLLEHSLDTKMADVPSTLLHGGRARPLGRYLTRKLREAIGHDPAAPQSTIDAVAAQLQPLRLAARADSEAPSLREQIVKANQGKLIQLEHKQRIYKKARPL